MPAHDLPARAVRAAITLGAARLGFGAVMLGAPAMLPRLLGADRVTARRVGHLGRMIGIREIALGVGTLQATRGDAGELVRWVVAQALSDAGDAASVAAGIRAGHVARLTGGLVVLAGAGGAVGDLAVVRMLQRAR